MSVAITGLMTSAIHSMLVEYQGLYDKTVPVCVAIEHRGRKLAGGKGKRLWTSN